MLISWMADNKTQKWSEGLRFIQSKKNRALHSVIKTSPYEAMFGSAQKIGLADSFLSADIYTSLETEEELEQLLYSVNNNIGENNTIKKEDDEQLSYKTGVIIQESGKEVDIKMYCVVCKNETLEAHKCSGCQQYVYIICGESDENNENFGQNVTCKLCIRKKNINVEREFVVRVPDVDRGRTAPRNILAVVAGINASGLYELGTKEGHLDRLYGSERVYNR
ncbi:hypothetical protein KPH14_001001 [Odynerus spinipes]|uniref:SCAN domain-containing protein n=1 Tax=Odynerus spinipes TaxID=1348599 RepID=A0AAD9VN00_9HYME|nr:hypothetical protein KPH14_001001 [Odynerus spinipes]